MTAAGRELAALVLVVASGWLMLASRQALLLARRSRIGAESEAQVRRVLYPLAREGWWVRHSITWAGEGDLDHVARAPSGLGFVIETKTRAYSAGHLERTLRAARWLAGRRRRDPRGVVAVICIARSSRIERVEAGVLVVSLDRLMPALRRAAVARTDTTAVAG
jgi:hypothetical protein